MNQVSTSRVIIYSTPVCPDCRVLKEWLSQQSIMFEERDLTDPKISAEAKSRTGARVAPITPIGNEAPYDTFANQKPGLMKALGRLTSR